jgi:His-Xaa-Ser system protein HxsD
MKTNMRIEKNSVTLTINPQFYPLETVYSAAYVFLDRAYILLDGNPKKEVCVRMKAKEKGANLERLGGEFLNELINYADYSKRAEQTRTIREMILQRALLTNDRSIVNMTEIDSRVDEIDDSTGYIDDPLGIATPWEEKYGKGAQRKKRKNAKSKVKQ